MTTVTVTHGLDPDYCVRCQLRDWPARKRYRTGLWCRKCRDRAVRCFHREHQSGGPTGANAAL